MFLGLGCDALRCVLFVTRFASLLIQGGASLAYVKEQMGHSSIQVIVDIYGHLIPSGNIDWVGTDTPTSPQVCR